MFSDLSGGERYPLFEQPRGRSAPSLFHITLLNEIRAIFIAERVTLIYLRGLRRGLSFSLLQQISTVSSGHIALAF